MRLWAGISAVSATLQRRVWASVKGQRCFANTYVLLVGPPGVGKGNAMKFLTPWLRDIDVLKISPDALTSRSFYDVMEHSLCQARHFEEGGSVDDLLNAAHSSLTAFIEELGVFLQPGDTLFISELCHMYDSPLQHHYKTQHAGENFIERAWFSMLSATTPKSLKDIFSDQAMEMGISARTVIIYSEEKIEVEIFGQGGMNEKLEKDLKYDLRRMTDIHGEYQFDNEAAEELVAWVKGGMQPIPKDPRFEHYNSRRFVHLVKLCIICAASKRQDPVILPVDLFQAKTFLLEAEREMPKAIATLGANPYLGQQQLAMKIVNENWVKNKRPTGEGELRQKMSSDLDPRYADLIVNDLAKARWVSCFGKFPDRTFLPRGRERDAGIDTAVGQGNTQSTPTLGTASDDESTPDPSDDE